MAPRFVAQVVGGTWHPWVNKERRRNLSCTVSLGCL